MRSIDDDPARRGGGAQLAVVKRQELVCSGREADRQRLDVDGVEDRPPRGHPVFAYPYVSRLDLWPVPNGPMILAVGLGHPPDAVLVRGMTPTDQAGLRLCPSFPGEIGRLEPGR